MRSRQLSEIFNYYALLVVEEEASSKQKNVDLYKTHEAVELSYCGSNILEIVCRNAAYKMIFDAKNRGEPVELDFFCGENSASEAIIYFT